MDSVAKLSPIFIALMLSSSLPFVQAEEETSATLEDVAGEVLFNTGQRYQKAASGVALKEGDRVMVMEGAEVKINYSDGCSEIWQGAKIAEVNAASCGMAAAWIPCLGGAAAGGGQAIILTKVIGAVLLKTDDEFVQVSEGQELEYGDQLKIANGAEAEVNYEGSCSKSWSGGTVDISEHTCPIAELSKVEGDILVEQAGTYSPAKNGVRLLHGDTVQVPKGSSVTVIYDNGCDASWDGKETVSIDASACPLAAVIPSNCAAPVLGNMTPLGVGVFIAVPVAGILISDRNKPVSP